MKTAFLLGGFNIYSTAKDGMYPIIEDGLTAKGYNVMPVGISWRQKIPSRYTEEFIDLFNAEKTKRNIVIGNSFGAVVTLLAMSRIDIDEAYLCSLSPFFREDRGILPDAYGIRYFGERRMNDLWSYSAKEAAESITGTKVHVLYGEKECQTLPSLVDRCQEIARMIVGADIHEIAGAPHNMVDPVYSQAVVDLVPPANEHN